MICNQKFRLTALFFVFLIVSECYSFNLFGGTFEEMRLTNFIEASKKLKEKNSLLSNETNKVKAKGSFLRAAKPLGNNMIQIKEKKLELDPEEEIIFQKGLELADLAI